MPVKRFSAIVAAIALVVGAGVATAATARTTTSPAGVMVTVHGKWTIVVRNKHGKVVQLRRFENSLVPSGAGVIASLLAGTGAAGSWGVNITFGAIVDSHNTASDSPPFYKNLQVTAPTSGPDANKVVLSGSATPTADSTITHVDTYLGLCTSPSTALCTSPASTQVTSKQLDGLNGDPAAVPVAAGQQVSVTVKLSFS
jgi:hypothetical protein